jgi:hypothetical protein
MRDERKGRSGEVPAEENGAAAIQQSPVATAASEVVTQLARSAAGELVKGQQPRKVATTIVAEAVEEIDRRGPALAEDAGIMNWRYALLGYVTWQVGKRVIKRKAKRAVGRGGQGHEQLERSTDG